MDPEKAKLIASLIDKIPITIPILVASGISIITLMVSYKNGKRQSSLNMITNRRIEWLEIIRNELADFIGDVHLLNFKFYVQTKEKIFNPEPLLVHISNAVAKGNKLIFRLNPEEDNEIIEIIEYLIDFVLPNSPEDIEDHAENLKNIITNLRKESQKMLKNEMDKVKREVGR